MIVFLLPAYALLGPAALAAVLIDSCRTVDLIRARRRAAVVHAQRKAGSR